MTSFFSGLLSSLKVVFFAPPRTESPQLSKDQSSGNMATIGLPNGEEEVSKSPEENSEEVEEKLSDSKKEVKELSSEPPANESFLMDVSMGNGTGCETSVSNSGNNAASSSEFVALEPVPLVFDDNNSPLILLNETAYEPATEKVGNGQIQAQGDPNSVGQSSHFRDLLSSQYYSPSLNFESPAVTSEQDSFFSASSQALLMEFNNSPEPMEIDYAEDAPKMTSENAEDVSYTNDNTQCLDESVGSKTIMNPEEPAVPPVAAVVPPTAVPAPEEKPVCGKGSYAIDWDNFDENAVPCPFGGRASSTGKSKSATATKRVPKKPTKAEETPKQDQAELSGTAADTNANEVELGKTQDAQLPKNTAEDLKNSNVIQDAEKVEVEKPADEKAVVQNAKDTVTPKAGGSKTGRQTSQQTAVVAPTVHVAAAVSAGTKAGKPPANELRRPSIKSHSNSPDPSVAQPVQEPRVNNCHDGVKGARSDGGAVSEKDTFVAASSNPFNNTADFEYLQQAGGSASNVGGSDLHRQSLYANFDPLVSGDGCGGNQDRRMSEASVMAPAGSDAVSLHDITITERTKLKKKKDDLLLMNAQSPVRHASKGEEVPSTAIKKKNGSRTQAASNDSFARGDHADVDRLMAASPNQVANAPAATGVTREAKLQFQSLLLAKEKEFALRLQEEIDRRVKLEQELAAVKKEAEGAKLNAAEMSFVVAEYEKTVRQLIAERDKPKHNRVSGEYDIVVKDRDQALDDLQTVENAFSELNRRYETLRNSTIEFKKNEEALKASLADCQHKLRRLEEKYNKLYAHAEHKLALANQEIEKLDKAKETDTLALRAQLKKRDLQVETLEKNLEQKQKEIHELTGICDELIQKAGAH